MARCGCTSQCSCLLIAGPGVIVNGTGTPSNPYVVSSDTAIGCEAVQDCMGEAAGEGLQYDDAANELRAHLSGDATNLLAYGTDGGLYVPGSSLPEGKLDLTGGTLTGDLIISEAELAIISALSTDPALKIRANGDTQQRLMVDGTGKLNWGPGNAAADASLARTAVAELTATGKLVVTGALQVNGAGQRLYVVKNADENVINSTALQDDDALTLPLAANATYEVVFVVAVAGPNAAGVKTSWTVPAGVSTTGPGLKHCIGPVGTDRDSSLMRSGAHFYGTSISYGTDTTAQSASITERGVITTGASSGSVTLQWAQNTANATAVTVNAGSYAYLTRIS